MILFPERATAETLELRQVIEGGVNIWDFEYPSYYEGDEKKAFEQKVIDHFYLRQIGAETVGRFLHYFRRTVREIMPLYIQRYKSVDLMKDPEIRPLDNYNMVETFKQTSEQEASGTATDRGTTSETSTGSGSGTKNNNDQGKNTAVHSETPESTLNISLGAPSLEKVETIGHASDTTQNLEHKVLHEETTASENTESNGEHMNNRTETSSSDNTTEHTLTRRGNIGVTTYAQLLEGYRQTFLNIDMEIIDELEICFLGVY